jgi:hypothetical protein
MLERRPMAARGKVTGQDTFFVADLGAAGHVTGGQPFVTGTNLLCVITASDFVWRERSHNFADLTQ